MDAKVPVLGMHRDATSTSTFFPDEGHSREMRDTRKKIKTNRHAAVDDAAAAAGPRSRVPAESSP